MITIKCTEPVCGKEFQFDDEKNPNAKKTRCPYCKGIVDLAASESKIIKPIKEEGIVSASIPMTPISTKEDNFNLQPKVNFPTTPVANSMQETTELPTSGINYKWLVLGGIVLVILSFILYRGCINSPIPEAKPIYVMPDYKIILDDYNAEYTLNSNIVLSGFIQPKLDPHTSVLLTANGDSLILDSFNRFEFKSKYTNKKIDLGEHIVNLRLKCSYSDSLFSVDTQNISFKVVVGEISKKRESKDVKSNPPAKIMKDLYNLASVANWYKNDKPTDKISLNGGSSPDGHLTNESNVTLEDSKLYSKGITIYLGKRNGSNISGEYKFNPTFLSNISGEWGFTKINDKNDENKAIAQLELTQFFEDGSSENIYNKQKGYTSDLFPINKQLQNPKKTIMIKIKAIRIKGGKTPPRVFFKNIILN